MRRIYALPWELLTLKSGQLLGELPGLLLRFEWPECKAVPEPLRSEGGRIVLAWSAAGGAVPAPQHVRAIQEGCRAGFHPFDPDRDVLPHASLSRLVQTLATAEKRGEPIAVLHLLCHGSAAGSTFGLALDGNDGVAVADAALLRQQLAPFARMVRLVVLSACDSSNVGSLGNRLGSIAQTLHRAGFAAVVASRFPLSAAGSTTLTETLYRLMLVGPESLESALLAARQALASREATLPASQRPLDWASVQLYANHDDGDDSRPILFQAKPDCASTALSTTRAIGSSCRSFNRSRCARPSSSRRAKWGWNWNPGWPTE